MKKRILAAVMCGMMVMAGCSGGGSGQSSTAAPEKSTAAPTTEAQAGGEVKETEAKPEEKKYSFAFFTNTLNNTFHNAMVEVYTENVKSWDMILLHMIRTMMPPCRSASWRMPPAKDLMRFS